MRMCVCLRVRACAGCYRYRRRDRVAPTCEGGAVRARERARVEGAREGAKKSAQWDSQELQRLNSSKRQRA